MHKFILFIKEFRVPSKSEMIRAIKSFSIKEISTLILIGLIALISFFIIVSKINDSFMTDIPMEGGTLTEGIIGTPNTINPVLAFSEIDKDLTSLIYSGLTRKNSDGTFILDLASSGPDISMDGKTYTFQIRDDAKFHDGEKVTADDVVFTINKIKDPFIRSPQRINWVNVEVSKKDEQTIEFKLDKPNISFIDNTTIGILPEHIWRNVSETEFNLSLINMDPIGSGPYKIKSIIKNKENIAKEYRLESFNDFTISKPNIKKLNIISYSNEGDIIKALTNKEIDQAGGISPENANKIDTDRYIINTSTLPKIFGLFINLNKNKLLENKNIIDILDKSIDKQYIIDKVLSGYGTVADSPIPETILSKDQSKINPKKYTKEEIVQKLESLNFKMGEDGIRAHSQTKTIKETKKVGKKTVTTSKEVPTGETTKLSFTITTVDTKELKEVAEIIKDQLKEFGINIEIKVYEIGQLNKIIKERDYEILLFGQIVSHESDLYLFWHSSQKTDPGLNVALYNNKRVDTLLETIQKTFGYENRMERYKELIYEFNNDIGAILLYSPKYLYITNKDSSNISTKTLINQQDRLNKSYDWYAKKDRVWKIFTK
jgi:peptide/nickel transport system substrate-binding protein